LFILAGAIMNASGISRRLIAFASCSSGGCAAGARARVDRRVDVLRRNLRPAVADIAALGSILIPAMKSKGYPRPWPGGDVLGGDACRHHPASIR